MDLHLHALSCLDLEERKALSRAGLSSVHDLFISPTQELEKKMRLPGNRVEEIIQKVSIEVSPTPQTIRDSSEHEQFSTGDARLDQIICGGIKTGVIWEISGEGGAGKTQLALQLALMVQLPPEAGGLSGSACYLSAGSMLPTTRLEQLVAEHPRLSPDFCTLSNIHIHDLPVPRALTYVLSTTLPKLIDEASTKPIKLVIIDSLASLFRNTTTHIFERSKILGEVSSLLHYLATKHRLAVIVINEVTDVFGIDAVSHTPSPNHPPDPDELVYKEQSRWFNRPLTSVWGIKKEAGLGLVWANQINVRLFMSRTERREVVDMLADAATAEASNKRPRLDSTSSQSITTSQSSQATAESSAAQNVKTQQPIMLRRLDVVFSCFGPPSSVDFVITPSGLRTMGDENGNVNQDLVDYFGTEVDAPPIPSSNPQIPGLLAASLPDENLAKPLEPAKAVEEDEWDMYNVELGDSEYDEM